MILSGVARGPEDKRRHQNEDDTYYITILVLQCRQISEMAGAACHEEVFQYPARWMSSKTEECH